MDKKPYGLNIRPILGRMIVRRLEKKRTADSIIVPDSAAEKSSEGEVLAVGLGRISESGEIQPLDVKVGDRVVFGKYAGTPVKVGSEELLVLDEKDIIGVLDVLSGTHGSGGGTED